MKLTKYEYEAHKAVPIRQAHRAKIVQTRQAHEATLMQKSIPIRKAHKATLMKQTQCWMPGDLCPKGELVECDAHEARLRIHARKAILSRSDSLGH